ncbi:ABC transporter substrate-binding protein [bacterium]|nr:MAG: ABC transporter substrate-binding protein [bacterium]
MKKRKTVFAIVFFTLLLLFTTLELAPCYAYESEQVKLQIITEDFAPFNFRSEDGEITGQSTEIVQEILSRLNLKIDIHLMPWNDGYELALSEPDVALYSTFRTTEREELFQWVGPIGADEYVFYALKNSGLSINSLEDAKKVQAIGVVQNDARHQFLKQNNVTNLKLYQNDAECYRALASGDVDLVVGSSETMAQMARQAGVDPSELKPVYSLRKTPLYITFNKNTSKDIVKQWQDTLDEMKRDGTFDEINERWGGISTQGYSKLDATVGITTIAATKLLAGFVDVRLDEFLSVLQTLSFTDEARSGKWKKLKPILVEREKVEPAGRIWYVLPDGSYNTTVDDLTSKNLKDRSYFPGLIAGNLTLGTIVVSKSTGKTVAIAGAPIFKKGKVKGALGTSIYMQNINDEVQNAFPLQSYQMFFAVSDDGTIALHSDDAWIGQKIAIMSSNLKSILDKNAGECNFTSEGKDWHAVWVTAPKTGWHVAIASIVE